MPLPSAPLHFLHDSPPKPMSGSLFFKALPSSSLLPARTLHSVLSSPGYSGCFYKAVLTSEGAIRQEGDSWVARLGLLVPKAFWLAELLAEQRPRVLDRDQSGFSLLLLTMVQAPGSGQEYLTASPITAGDRTARATGALEHTCSLSFRLSLWPEEPH